MKIEVHAADAPAAAPAVDPWIHIFYYEPYFLLRCEE